MVRDVLTVLALATFVCGSFYVSPALSGGTVMVALQNAPSNSDMSSVPKAQEILVYPAAEQSVRSADVCEPVCFTPENRPEQPGANGVALPAEPVVAVRMVNKPPAYPRIARERGYEGTVVVSVAVRDDGTCGDVRVRKSSGHRVLDAAVVKTVKQWRFDLSWLAPEAAGARMLDVPFEFRLEDR